jgi:hypothetical protein
VQANVLLVIVLQLQGGAGIVESMAISGLSKSPAPSAVALSARRLTSLASASETLKSPSPSGTIRSSTPCQKNWPSISTIKGVVGAAHVDSCPSYRFALTCSS